MDVVQKLAEMAAQTAPLAAPAAPRFVLEEAAGVEGEPGKESTLPPITQDMDW